jgi:hypothetical protein
MWQGPTVGEEKERERESGREVITATISYSANGNATQNGYRVFLRDALLADWLIDRSVDPKQPKSQTFLPPIGFA